MQNFPRELAVSFLALACLAPPALGATLTVDDDRVQCSAAAYATIQAAVDAATAGDTVRVCAGTYDEQVRILKSLFLHGPRKGADARSRSPGSSGEARVRATRPFIIEAPKVVVDGFAVVVQLDGEGEGSGVLVTPAGSGYRILNNVIDAGPVPGVELHGVAGTLAYIQRNHIRGPIGIRAEHGQVGNLVIRQNLLVNGTIAFTDARHDLVHIVLNTLRHHATGVAACERSPALPCRPSILIRDAGSLRVERNSISGSGAYALQIVDSERVRVVDNRLRSGKGVAIDVRDVRGSATDTQLLGNRIAGFSGPGVSLAGASGVLVEGNEIEDSQAGIVLTGAAGNRVAANNIEDNASYGIDVSGEDAGGGDNVLSDNEVRGNDILDCRDRTTGSGSYGTANTWLRNEGSRSSPAGLCVDSP